MARSRRYFNAATTQHVIQRGNNKTRMFAASSDYEAYLYLLREAVTRYDLEIHSYVLMTTHVHLMTTARLSQTLPSVMHRAGFRYVRFFNRRYDRTGTLLDGRYSSLPIETEGYWYNCMRYIEQNPVRAGIVASPADYRWSSFGANGLGRTDPLVTPHRLYLQLGETPEQRCEQWRRVCATPLTEQELTEISIAIRADPAELNSEVMTVE